MGKISDYTRVLAAKLADVFVVDQTDNGTTETKSATVEQIGTAIGKLQNFADLDTSNKNLVDAINEIASYTPVYGNTASGAIATFDTSLALPLQDLQIAINAVETGDGNPKSPSNPYTISGFTGSNIRVVGANLFSLTEDTIQTDRQASLSNCTKTDTSVTATSTANNYACFGRYIFLPKGNYTIKFQATSSDVGYTPTITIYRDGNKVVRTQIQPNTPTSFTLTDDKILEVRMFVTYSNDPTIRSVTFSDIQIEKGNSVSTTYTPYVGNTTAITWQSEAGTVYGGSLDVTSGVLVVTHAIVDMGSFAWNNASGNLSSSSGIASDVKAPSANTEAFKGLCSCYEVAPRTGIADKQISVQTNGNIVISDTGIASMSGAQVQAYVTGFILVYELATPTTYQLTPNSTISAIVGTNNIFTDTNGDTSIVYACSLKDYIDGQ